MVVAILPEDRVNIKLPGRQSIENKKSKLPSKEYEQIIERLNKENEEHTDQIYSLKNILTQHKDRVEDSLQKIKSKIILFILEYRI